MNHFSGRRCSVSHISIAASAPVWLQSLVWPLDTSMVYCQNTTSFLDFERTRQPVDCSFQSGVHQIFFLLPCWNLYSSFAKCVQLHHWQNELFPQVCWIYITYPSGKELLAWGRPFEEFLLKESASWRPFWHSYVKPANHIQPCWSLRTLQNLPALVPASFSWEMSSCSDQTGSTRLLWCRCQCVCLSRAASRLFLLKQRRSVSPFLERLKRAHGWSRKNSGLKSQLFWLPRCVHLHLGRSSNKTRLGRILPRARQNNSGLCFFSPSS